MSSSDGGAHDHLLDPEYGLNFKLSMLEISESAKDTAILAVRMQQRCSLLLGELEQFQAHLKQQKKEKKIEVRAFKTGLHAEMKLLNKLATADFTEPKTRHGLRSSNLSFFDTVWSIAKTCTSVTALGKRFFWLPEDTAGKGSMRGTRHRKDLAQVDIVAQDGLEWIKVSSITEKRVIWDLTRAGWVGDSSSEDDEDIDPSTHDNEDDTGLLKQVEALVKASKNTWVRYRHPTVRLILPRIKAVPDSKEVGDVLKQIRKMGVIVETSDTLSSGYPEISSVIEKMCSDRYDSFSNVLNIDCTILLAFASDLSHGRVEPEDWHIKAISRQIELEKSGHLLPSNLWPACSGRKMVCTREAAVRMQEIVATIGTETERKRGALLINTNPEPQLSQGDRIREFQALSDYDVPTDWMLPIEVVDFDFKTLTALPAIAQQVSDSLTPINQSVLLYGWASGNTTISSNASVAKDIEAIIEANRDNEEIIGPDVWLSASSRSLVGKEKERRGHSEIPATSRISRDASIDA